VHWGSGSRRGPPWHNTRPLSYFYSDNYCFPASAERMTRVMLVLEFDSSNICEEAANTGQLVDGGLRMRKGFPSVNWDAKLYIFLNTTMYRSEKLLVVLHVPSS
jgi:hypothetical protein